MMFPVEEVTAAVIALVSYVLGLITKRFKKRD